MNRTESETDTTAPTSTADELHAALDAYAALLPGGRPLEAAYLLGVLLGVVAGEPDALAAVTARIQKNTAYLAGKAVSS